MFSQFGIRSRLLLLILVPLLVLAGFGVLELGQRRTEARQAESLSANVDFGIIATDLVHELQRERGLSSGFVGNPDETPFEQVATQRANADSARAQFGAALGELQTGADLAESVMLLDALTDHRSRIDRGEVDVAETLAPYTAAIRSVLTDLSTLDFTIDDGALTQELVALRALTDGKEWTGLERGFANGVVSRGEFLSGEEHARYLALRQNAEQSIGAFQAQAQPQVQALFDERVTSIAPASEALRDQLRLVAPNEAIAFPASQWWTIMTERIDAMRVVEVAASDRIADTATGIADAANRAVVTFTVVALALAVALAALALMLARSIIGPLRGLTSEVDRTAREELPRTIERIAAGEEVIDTDIAAGRQRTGPAEVHALSESMDSLRETATSLASEQARMRRNVGDLFVNLGRRNQSLLNRQLELIDDLEQSEQDPDTLGNLYRLDHLSTRIRRNAESLLVLAGAESPRMWTRPIDITDLIRASISETEDYTRLEVGAHDQALVAGSAVSDLTHLLAELAENATRFSPPTTGVRIAGRRLAEGYVIVVADEGIGMEKEQMEALNQLLSEPSDGIDLEGSDRLGLHVVSRLAARHGVQVELQPNGVAGVAARVTIPSDLLTDVRADEAPAAAAAVVEAPASVPEPALQAAAPAQPAEPTILDAPDPDPFTPEPTALDAPEPDPFTPEPTALDASDPDPFTPDPLAAPAATAPDLASALVEAPDDLASMPEVTPARMAEPQPDSFAVAVSGEASHPAAPTSAAPATAAPTAAASPAAQAGALPALPRRRSASPAPTAESSSPKQIAQAVRTMRTDAPVETPQTTADRKRLYLDPIRNRESENDGATPLTKRVRKTVEEKTDVRRGPQMGRDPEEVRSMLSGFAAGRARAEQDATDGPDWADANPAND